MSTEQAQVDAVERFVAHHIAGYDASHDLSHIRRVVATALSLASDSACSLHQRHLVHLTALLHDLPDPKYCADPPAVLSSIADLLASVGCPPADVAYVLALLPLLSFKDQLASLTPHPLPLRLPLSSPPPPRGGHRQ